MQKLTQIIMAINFVFIFHSLCAQQNNFAEKKLSVLLSGKGISSSSTQMESSNTYHLVSQAIVKEQGCKMIRLFFSPVNLDKGSYLKIISKQDGDWQRLDATSLENWNYSSAYFNGDELKIQLWSLNSTSAEIEINNISYLNAIASPESQCGSTDDRTLSVSNRVARIMPVGCTGWQISSGAFLTAGHCTGSMSVIQFNVPSSLSDGTPVAPPVNDQYPVIGSSIVFENAGNYGDDWCLFKVNPNSNTGRLPHEANGNPDAFNSNFYCCTRSMLPGTSGLTTAVIGFGTDNVPVGSTGGANAQNQTNQMAFGPFVAQSGSGNTVELQYTVDTEGGNSGSPVSFTGSNIAIGIHTNAGCVTSNPPGYNHGTSFESNDLEAVLNTAYGPNVAFVDVNHPNAMPLGIFMNPFPSIQSAATLVGTNTELRIAEGYYQESIIINTDVVLKAPVGLVVINPNNQLISQFAKTNDALITKESIELFPNPANDYIALKISNGDSKTICKIYNSTMQLIKSFHFENGIENKISTADLSPGIYFIDAQTESQSYKTKFVISR